MSFGTSPGDRAEGRYEVERLKKQAAADLAAREAGYKSPLRRLLSRFRRAKSN
jgi:hypothetical protein